MMGGLLVALLPLAAAGVHGLRPQWISTLRGLPERRKPRIDRRVGARSVAGGMALPTLSIAGMSWGLAAAGAEGAERTVVRIIVAVAGVIVVAARVERYNR